MTYKNFSTYVVEHTPKAEVLAHSLTFGGFQLNTDKAPLKTGASERLQRRIILLADIERWSVCHILLVERGTGCVE